MKSWKVQQAVYAAIAASAAVDALTTGVFDDAPAGQAYPYVTLGESTDTPDDLLTAKGNTSTITIHVWDRTPSYSRIKQIMDAVDDALHNAALLVSGVQIVAVRREMAETMKDADGETRRGVMRYRVDTFEG
jgi:hypothetical protein